MPQVPNEADEILLGDVIISSAVVQYDLRKRNPDKFIHKDTVEKSAESAEIMSLIGLKWNARSWKEKDKVGRNMQVSSQDAKLQM